ncbi:MAG: 16S rRNA (adenine(1518)-N(6)/adenine(1519)-N(6))-dimethyltransferase RsmA [Alicyclobacillus herbarius]|uniref:16S rRNA (adenine(1518)-N(6)/adenine(1519)-N(6))- dimethyltransferase RsmA n=1 Tax=Alicyclobacillus herbarius TaxID=122960 RepID=UPI003B5CCB63|nr:16S rRNA (adenine(1518)-N(6)/adenine(1519)-N(6))-dimethyltransferase RsmA [Alicyclobacillus herbarius]
MRRVSETLELVKAADLKRFLARYGFTLKKGLGQNFLIDGRVLNAIVEAADIAETDGVLEIGPGAGVLTQRLAARAKRVVAVEKDQALRPLLAESLAEFPHVRVLFADVLEVDLAGLWSEFTDCARVHVVANLPYYVTTPILFHILESDVNVSNILVMVQKEVADRLAAPPGGKAYGALSVMVQYRAEVERVVTVSPSSFLPPPGVDSVVVRLTCRPPVCPAKRLADLQSVVRAAFATRRKTLANALSGGLGLSRDDARELLESAGIQPDRRGETLGLCEFVRLANAYTDNLGQNC